MKNVVFTDGRDLKSNNTTNPPTPPIMYSFKCTISPGYIKTKGDNKVKTQEVKASSLELAGITSSQGKRKALCNQYLSTTKVMSLKRTLENDIIYSNRIKDYTPQEIVFIGKKNNIFRNTKMTLGKENGKYIVSINMSMSEPKTKFNSEPFLKNRFVNDDKVNNVFRFKVDAINFLAALEYAERIMVGIDTRNTLIPDEFQNKKNDDDEEE